jgi:hypothetical protein
MSLYGINPREKPENPAQKIAEAIFENGRPLPTRELLDYLAPLQFNDLAAAVAKTSDRIDARCDLFTANPSNPHYKEAMSMQGEWTERRETGHKLSRPTDDETAMRIFRECLGDARISWLWEDELNKEKSNVWEEGFAATKKVKDSGN